MEEILLKMRRLAQLIKDSSAQTITDLKPTIDGIKTNFDEWKVPWTADRAGKIDTIDTKIGSTADTGGSTSGSVMGKLNKIHDISGLVGLNGTKYYPVMEGTADILISRSESLRQSGGAYSIAIDDSYIYYADDATNQVIKFNKSDMSKVSETSVQSGYSQSIAIDDSYIYYADDATRKVIKFNKSDMSKVSETSVQSGRANSIAIDDSYIYYADYRANKVIKFNKSDMSKVSVTEAQSGYSQSIAIDDSYIYYADCVAKKVIKFNKSDMSKVVETEAQSGCAGSIAIDDSYIYYANHTANKVIKFDINEKTLYNLTRYVGDKK